MSSFNKLKNLTSENFKIVLKGESGVWNKIQK